MQLTKNFELREFVRSSTASQMMFHEQFDPPDTVIKNLKELCTHVIQPLRDFINQPVFISSGYRCDRLNKAIGGAKDSQHKDGKAADLLATGEMDNITLYKAVIQAKLPFDQMILEFPDIHGEPGWIHVSYNAERNRGEILNARIVAGEKKYTKLS